MLKFVKPREGLLVRDPISKTPIPETGTNVDWSGHAGRYWRRRVKCGDVSIVEPEATKEVVVEEEAKPIIRKTTSKKR